MAKLFIKLLALIPMGGARTYITGFFGLLLAALLFWQGSYDVAAALGVTSLQVIFLRAGTDKLFNLLTAWMDGFTGDQLAVVKLPDSRPPVMASEEEHY